MNIVHWEQLLVPDKFSISREEYDKFCRWYVMYALADKRFGQAFCEHYGIRSMLYYMNDRKFCERWIEDNYIKQ